MVLLSHSSSLTVILSITLFTFRKKINSKVKKLKSTKPDDKGTESAYPNYPTFDVSQNVQLSQFGQYGHTFSLKNKMIKMSISCFYTYFGKYNGSISVTLQNQFLVTFVMKLDLTYDTFSYHSTGNSFCFLRWNFQQLS